MEIRLAWITLALALSLGLNAQSEPLSTPVATPSVNADSSLLDELDPFDPQVEEILNTLDLIYENETGEPAWMQEDLLHYTSSTEGCYRASCPVWAQISKSRQRMYLYENGVLIAEWKVSTGTPGRGTPNFDRHPNGRIYDRYTSTKWPGGDYKNLGNMPYAVFISGGFAIHGTGEGNWKRLGTRASHGCIRLHPDNGFKFNRMVRSYGIKKTWITVQE